MLSQRQIKLVRSLQQKKFREEEGMFVIEGEKSVNEAIRFASDKIISIFHTSEFTPNSSNAHFELITQNELEKLSSLQTPNKAIAILKKLDKPKQNIDNELILVLDNIQDPGNLGTIIRSAHWFGIKNIVCSLTTVDCYNPKVVQSTMGSIFHVNMHYIDLEVFLSKTKLPIYGALLNGKSIYKEKLPENALVVLGNEGKGISENIKKLIQSPITIPNFGNAESLNAAVATSIILSEFRSKNH